VRIDAADVRATLFEILDSYEQVQNTVQKGNPYVYLALPEFLHGAGATAAAEYLRTAEEIWTRPGQVTPAGLQRIAVFRRFCGIASE
jgi:hypothetical protein